LPVIAVAGEDHCVIALLLAAGSAVIWGAGDFLGGKASQRGNPLAVAIVSQLACLPVIAVFLLLFPGQGLAGTDIAWALGAGACGLLGIVLLYHGLASGAMTVVAPITAVTAAALPLVIGLFIDRIPGPLALSGAVLAVISIGLVSAGPSRERQGVTRRLLGVALAAGAMFGVFFTLLGQVRPGSGMWPLVAVRTGSLVLGFAICAVSRVSLRLPRKTLPWAVPAGVFDIIANALYLAAAQAGPLSIVAPVAALYPASTVLLAMAVERERVRPTQLAGLGLAASALVLIAT
jgi:drug/metabolite transporter (DMT)-like permease